MSDREHAHALIDRLPEAQLSALVGLLETIVDPVVTALRNAPWTTSPKANRNNRTSRRPEIGSSLMVVKAFRMKKRCAAWS
jgi:hypothetical protein